MGLDIGGAETHIVELAKELRRRGHEVLAVSNGGVYTAELEAAGIRHVWAPLHRRSLVPMLKSYFILKKTIRREKPDIVHAHARIPGFLCGLVRKTVKFPFVTTAHWVFDAGGALRFLTNWGEKTVAVSDDIKTYLQDNYGIDEKNIFVTINGIDTDKFSPHVSGERVRSEFGIPADAPVVAHVSRMDESRALAAKTLIEAAEELDALIPGVTILMAGDGDRFSELSEAARRVNERLGRKGVILAGARTDINEFVAAGDVFVGVSRAALEAMSAAKPCVVAGNEGYLGIFTLEKLDEAVASNFCCRGSAAMDKASLVRDIAALFSLSEAQRADLGNDGRTVILERYSVKRMADDTVEAYRAATTPRKIVMSGYYGFGNAGDEAILESVLGSIRRTMPDAEVTVLSRDPALTAKTYGCLAAPRFDPLALWRTVSRCDILISGGGSLLQDVTSTRSLLYYLHIIRMAERRHKRVLLVSNGIGPVRRSLNRRLVAHAVRKADIVTLRDPESLTELAQMGVARDDMTVTADPVFLLTPAGEERGREILRDAGVPEGKFAAVSVRPWGDDGFTEKLARVCDRLHDAYGLAIVFITMQPGRDDAESARIADKMTAPAYILPGGFTARELMSVISESELVLSMRLHSLIFAACMAVPAVGFSYDPKLDAYLAMLGQPSAGSVEDFTAESALTAARQIMENRQERVRDLKKKRADMQRAAKEGEKLLGTQTF